MIHDNFFERLLVLPLFQGIAHSEFMEIVERIRLGFQNSSEGKVLVKQGEVCSCLYFILSGEIYSKKISDNNNYEIKEIIETPTVLQPESLFGMSTHYTRTFVANSQVQILKIEKDAVRDILFYYPTFRINYLNMLSTRVQMANRFLWRKVPTNLFIRFKYFLSERCLRPAGHKILCMTMITLAEELSTTRLKVSKMLNLLADDGLIYLKRERIIIPNMEKIMMENYEIDD